MRVVMTARRIFAAFLVSLLLGLASPLLAAKAKTEKIDVNTATQQELESLPGVGAATAKKIIAGRPYASVQDLGRAGVPEKTIEKITPLVKAGRGAAAKAAPATSAEKPAAREEKKPEPKEKKEKAAAAVDLNTATQRELEDLPGVGTATAKKIIAGRPYTSVADLSKAGVNSKTIEKISPLVTVSTVPSGASSSSREGAPPAQRPGTSRPSVASAPAREPASSGAPTTAQAPPQKGMVWVNLNTKVFHREGDRWYGATKRGKYMTEADALNAGYRESREKLSKQ